MTSQMFDTVIELVRTERIRQDAKWGEQNHDAPLWKLILDEELGEVAKSYLEKDYINYIVELLQSAAVITAWAEAEYRRMTPDQMDQVIEAMKPKDKDLKNINTAKVLFEKLNNGQISKWAADQIINMWINIGNKPAQKNTPVNTYTEFLNNQVTEGHMTREQADKLTYGNFGKKDEGDSL